MCSAIKQVDLLKETGIFSNHDGTKTEPTKKRRTRNFPESVKINQGVQKEITREIRKYLGAGECGNTNTEVDRSPRKLRSDGNFRC